MTYRFSAQPLGACSWYFVPGA